MNPVLVEHQSRFVIANGPPLTAMASDLQTLDLLCALARFIGARRVVEAGTFFGHTAFALGKALQELGLGSRIWTADTTDHVPGGVAHAIGELGLDGIVTFFPGDFAAMLDLVPGEIDLAYIDASAPDQPFLRREHFDAVWPRVRVGGLVAVDDAGGAVQWARNATLYLPQRRGLAIYQKED